jgi:hypothetical protein
MVLRVFLGWCVKLVRLSSLKACSHHCFRVLAARLECFREMHVVASWVAEQSAL